MRTSTHFVSAFLVISAALSAAVSAQTYVALTGGELTIGSGNFVTDYTSSAAIGSGNWVNAYWSLAIGANNTIWNHRNMVVGIGNTADGMNNLVIGEHNELDDDDHGRSCILGGSYNFNDNGQNIFMIGLNNYNASSWNSAIVGMGLIGSANECLTVGRYNAHSYDAALIVGNGVNSVNRTNALEVHSSGKVLINKRQEDISMGEFGN